MFSTHFPFFFLKKFSKFSILSNIHILPCSSSVLVLRSGAKKALALSSASLFVSSLKSDLIFRSDVRTLFRFRNIVFEINVISEYLKDVFPLGSSSLFRIGCWPTFSSTNETFDPKYIRPFESEISETIKQKSLNDTKSDQTTVFLIL